MDAIRTYLDNIFAAFPQTERVRALKSEMLAGMEEKYLALKAEGKSEHEAVGNVIANFGDISEIAAELELERNVPAPESGISVSREEAYAFIMQMKKSSVGIGLGVWLVMAGVCAVVSIGGALGVFALLLSIAGAVPIFIVFGLRLAPYEGYDEQILLLDSQTRAEIQQQSKRITTCFVAGISAGVALVLLAVGAFIFLRTLEYQTFPLVLLLFTIGFAVFLIITAAMPFGAHEALLGKGEFENKTANKKAERLIGTVASVFWPVIVAAYLLWSFVGDAWGISWIIWPIAGILFGAFAGSISTWLDNRERGDSR